MKGLEFINYLASKGDFFFTTIQLQKALGISIVATRAVIRRLKKKSEIATPFGDFHLIVPPEYRILGCLPPEQFIPDLMHYLKIPYYVGLLSAGQFYGAAHQKPQVFQVVVPDNRLPISCGRVYIEFIARKHMNELPVRKFKTSKGYVAVSTPELTALDISNYSLRSGGLNNVVTVLEELSENINSTELTKLAKLIKVTAQLQRLGFLFDMIKQEKFSEIIKKELQKRSLRQVMLVPKLQNLKQTFRCNERWKIIINEEWESDL